MRRTIPAMALGAILTLCAPFGALAAEAPPGVSQPTLGQALGQAIAVQTALATGDWLEAGRQLDTLRAQLTELPGGTRQRLAAYAPVLESLEAGIRGQDLDRAQSAAYYMVYGLMSGLDAIAAAGGGGRAAPPEAQPGPAVMDHLAMAYQDTAAARLAIIGQNRAASQVALEAAALHLEAARRVARAPMPQLPILSARIRSAREALDEPELAEAEVRRALMAFADAMRQIAVASRPLTAPDGGGGGARIAPEAPPDDMTRLMDLAPRRDRPNQRGLQ